MRERPGRRRLEPGVGEEVVDRDALPRGVELAPGGDAVDVARDPGLREPVELRPGPRLDRLGADLKVKRQVSGTTRGVGPAERTGKSWVTDCPGGRRSGVIGGGAATGEAPRRHRSGAAAPEPAIAPRDERQAVLVARPARVFRQLEILLGRLPALSVSAPIFFISAEASCINVSTSCASFLVPSRPLGVRDGRELAGPSPVRSPS